VDDPEKHSFHSGVPEANRCAACHMPATFFARMERHDHSMLPPTPATSREFGSPDACVLCHTDKTADWADSWVRRWYEDDYQAPLLHRAQLVDAARKGDWSRLPEILDYLSDPRSNEIFAASLVRLLQACPRDDKWAAIIGAASHTSPLVRAAAASVLSPGVSRQTLDALLQATADERRLVRVQAGASLAGYPLDALSAEASRRVRTAQAEYESGLKSRLDDWSYQYSLGNYYARLGRFREAIEAFETSSRLWPDAVEPIVNASMAHAQLGEETKAEELLLEAWRLDPDRAETNFNLGLLAAGRNEFEEAEKYLRRALAADSGFHEAAYNLGVLLAGTHPEEALDWCRRAWNLQPENSKYSYTLAFYLHESGKLGPAAKILEDYLTRGPGQASVYGLLAAIYEQQGRAELAREVYLRASRDSSLSARDRRGFQARSLLTKPH
jgi:tetratricopeptide (TPR) repeat protein